MHTAQSARHFVTGTYGIGLVILVSLFAIPACLSSAKAKADGAGAASASEDPWRRTPNGWEVVDRWNRAGEANPSSSNHSFRLDSHPAVLALIQSLAIVAAFAIFPPRHFR